MSRMLRRGQESARAFAPAQQIGSDDANLGLSIMTLIWHSTIESFRRGEPERLGRDASPGPLFCAQHGCCTKILQMRASYCGNRRAILPDKNRAAPESPFSAAWFFGNHRAPRCVSTVHPSQDGIRSVPVFRRSHRKPRRGNAAGLIFSDQRQSPTRFAVRRISIFSIISSIFFICAVMPGSRFANPDSDNSALIRASSSTESAEITP